MPDFAGAVALQDDELDSQSCISSPFSDQSEILAAGRFAGLDIISSRFLDEPFMKVQGNRKAEQRCAW